MSNASYTDPVGATMPLEHSELPQRASSVEIVTRERYAVGDEIAQGGIGRILRASDKRLERPVALKQLLDPNPEVEARFLREALVTARLQHPAIVPVYDVGRFPDGEIFYVMKLVTGRSLGEVVEEAGTFDERLALLPHVIAVAEAIAYAHNEHIVHRDLKPANVLIGPFGETVVIDWGIAKDLREQEAANEALKSPENYTHGGDAGTSLTMVGSVLGTPGYMPPEQAAGNPVDERADVYALGAILYHVLAGVAPYEGKSGIEVLTRVLTEPPLSLSTREKRVPRDLLAIVSKAMEREPLDRYPSANEFAHDLRRFQTGQIVGAYHYSRLERFSRFVQKHRAVVATTVLGVFLVGVIGFTSLARVLDARRMAETERDRANEERARAEIEQAEAEALSQKSLQQSDELMLLEARTAARRDPNAAIAWLSSLSGSFQRWGEARLIAADAREFGIAKVLRGHTGVLNMIMYSPDGSLIATASDDRKVGLWTAEGKLIRMFEGHTDEVWKAHFSKDARQILSASKDGTSRIWDIETGQTVRTFHAHGPETSWYSYLENEKRSAFVNCLDRRLEIHDTTKGTIESLPGETHCPSVFALSPDHRIVTYMADGHPRVVDLETRIVRDYPSPDGLCLYMHTTEDGRFIGCSGVNGFSALWDAKTGHQINSTPASKIPSFGVAYFSPDGQTFLFGRNTTLHVRNLRTGIVRTFEHHQGPMFGGRFSHDNRTIVTTGFDRTAVILDLDTEATHQHYGFRDTTSWADFSPNDQEVAVASWDSTARIFPLAASRNRTITKGSSPMTMARFSADGQNIVSVEHNGTVHIDPVDKSSASGTSISTSINLEGERHVLAPNAMLVAYATKKGTLRIHKLESNTEDESLEGHEGAVKQIHFSKQNDKILTAGEDDTVRLWDLASRQSRILSKTKHVVKSVAFSNDGAHVAIGDNDGVVRVFPTAGGPERTFEGHMGNVQALTFLPNDKQFASGGHDHKVRIWDLEKGLLRTIDASGMGVTQVLASRDGTTLYSLGMESMIRRWNVNTGDALPIMRGHRAMVTRIDLFPEGSRIVSTASNGDIRLWDLSTGQSRLLNGHDDGVPWILVSPEGDKFISAGNDGTTRIWHDDLPFDGAGLRAWMATTSPDPADISPIVN